jgi:signal transduction histidine kinase
LQVLETGEAAQFREVIETENGFHHMLSAKFPMRTPEGEPCVGGISLDITEQEQIRVALARSEERLRLAIRGGVLGVWEWSGDDFNIMSRELCAYLGLETEEEAVEVPIDLIYERIHPEDAEAIGQAIERLVALGDGEFRQSVRVVIQGSEERTVLLIGQLHTTEAGPRMLGVAMDITETKRAEALIRRSQEELEREVDIRTRQLVVTNALLQREVEERTLAEEQLEEIRRLLTRSQETERMRLAHELHDGPMQELATIGYELTRARRKVNDDELAEELGNIRERLQEVNLLLRSFAGDLRPPLLDTFGLAAAIDGLVEQVQARTPNLALTTDLPADETKMNDDLDLAIYRICQQALHNMQRHARATKAHVALRFMPEVVELTVKDNGRGFEVPETWMELAREGHLGIVGMQERIRALGGELTLTSAPGKGTTLQVKAPRPR